ncbi:MAG TPA: rhomboid family intramembrane serine protease [Candidatus Deferrimicrobium sp.]|nr:rhomboid family intramembrane serine protease [Candidatus Deferrimicrobium sp.]
MVIEEPRPKKRPTIITWIIIAICIIVFIITLGPDGMSLNESSPIVEKLIFVPDQFFDGQNLHTLITAAFLHGDWIHITSNMYFLWIFGDDAEDVMGRSTFLIFYLFCAVFASVFYALVTGVTASLFDPNLMMIGCVGASGAIFGVMAAYIVFFPNRMIVVPGYGRITAKMYILLYAIMETLYIFLGGGGNVAHAAHVGGFIGGILFVFVFRKFNRPQYDALKAEYSPKASV